MRLKPFSASLIGVTAAFALAGCATTPETRVTRFHLGDQIARGNIAVEPIVPADAQTLEFQTYASIVGAELARIGFTEAPGLTKSEQVAVISVERGSREGAPQSRSGLSIGGSAGGGSYGGGGGVGVGISFPLGKRRPNEIQLTRLSVQIKRRSDATVIWEGRAETAAPPGAPGADPAGAVKMLAVALFKDFPGVSGKTITVR